MSLFFFHPAYLYGLFAASLPLLIHLLNRRRLKRIRFPAVRFILLSQRRISRSYRLRHWLVLALRTLAVILLVLLLAHPVFQTGVGLVAGSGPASIVVVLDNSLSMTWSEGGQGFEQAKQAITRLVTSLKVGDRAAVIPTYDGARATPRLKAERGLLLQDLEAIKLSATTADFALALKHAYALLIEPAAQKEIWLFTNMNLTGWDRFSLGQLEHYDRLIPLKIVKVGESNRLPNATIKELKFEGQGIGVGMPVHLTAQIVNFGDEEIKDVPVVLSLDGKDREQKLVSLPPQGELAVSFQFSLQRPGSYSGRVELKKAGLAGNPVSYFALRAEDKLRVLLVDGDPRTSLVQSETFFLARALNPSAGSDASLFLPTVVIPEGLSSVNFDSYQALVFCNVPTIPESLVPKLKDYVARGGGLLFFLGDRVQIEDYNRKLFQSSPAILPGPMKDKKILAASAGETIDKIDLGHPALQGLKERILQESLRSTRVQGYFLVEPNGASTLLALKNGNPVLLEKKVGSGRALFFTTAADREWSDLPVKTAYLPLVQFVVSYLAGGKRGSADPGLMVGSPKSFSLPLSYAGRRFRIVMPDDSEKELAASAEGEKAAAVFTENDLAGVYRLSFQGAPADTAFPPQRYAVNPPFLESRLKAIDEKEIREKLNPIRAEILNLGSLGEGGRSWDLSFPLLFLLFAALACEGWLAQKSHA
ncbi:MAG: BatA domain-containing protein [Deltaproteobacteria bacterium]|nr:BatA domain-containing protein [Deltaproteobacteria bacterium]